MPQGRQSLASTQPQAGKKACCASQSSKCNRTVSKKSFRKSCIKVICQSVPASERWCVSRLCSKISVDQLRSSSHRIRVAVPLILPLPSRRLAEDKVLTPILFVNCSKSSPTLMVTQMLKPATMKSMTCQLKCSSRALANSTGTRVSSMQSQMWIIFTSFVLLASSLKVISAS